MATGTILELVAAAALIAGGIVLYRRGSRDDPRYGSQGAVLLMVIGAIMLIHGLGGLEYRPSAAELAQ